MKAAMSAIEGLTKESCAAGCSVAGCVIGNSPRCAHPLKGGPPIETFNNPAMQVAFAEACAAIGVSNFLKPEEAA